jgi:sigma-B regulation protein RsbU (phosphoserine phosphatase)
MPPLDSGRILLCAKDAPQAQAVLATLRSSDFTVVLCGLDGNPWSRQTNYDLAIICAERRDREVTETCRRMRAQLHDSFVPIVLMADAESGPPQLDSLESGADVLLPSATGANELLIQILALVRLRRTHDRLANKNATPQDLYQRIEQAHAQFREEIDLARRIQPALLPQEMPGVPPLRFAVYHRPVERVGGDSYDVFRLDEDHVGFYMADVLAHGVGASLLTVFLKRALVPKEIRGHEYRLVPPPEVLARLNKEILALGLAESPFVTMLYGLLSRRDNQLTFARAGYPPPLYLPRGSSPVFCSPPGSFLGVFESHFTNQTLALRTGDKVLISSDGLDAAGDDPRPTRNEELRCAAERAQTLPIAELVAQVSRELLEKCSSPDDFTLLGIEVETSH